MVELRSDFGFLAFHGGSLEQVTDLVAIEAARRSHASVYAVIQPADLRWHLPSTDVTPDVSRSLARFLDHVDVAVALHGYGRAGLWSCVLVGGTNRRLAAHVAAPLRAALPDHEVVVDIDRIPADLRGLHPRNPVNLPRRGGAQLELPPRVRGLTPHWAGWRGPGLAPPTEAVAKALSEAAATWPRSSEPYGASRSRTQAPPATRR